MRHSVNGLFVAPGIATDPVSRRASGRLTATRGQVIVCAGMTVTGKHEPTQLEQAQDHLDRAVSRLESTMTGMQESAAASSAGLDAARRESASLKQVNADVSQRLDGAIGRLKSILEG